jgi:hypothetical protein
MLSRILIGILSILVFSCGGILMKKHYSDSFLKDIKTSKTFYKDGDLNSAFGTVNNIKDKDLSSSELAMKYNMLGFLHFSKRIYDDAIVNFKKALSHETSDARLLSQVNLNLASSYYKINDFKSAFVYITNVEYKFLAKKDFKIFTRLYYILAKDVDEPYDIVKAIVLSQRDAKSLGEVRDGKYSSILKEKYFAISKTGRTRFIEEFESKHNYAIAYLALNEAKKLYYSGDKSASRDFLQWIKDQFKTDASIIRTADALLGRMQSFAKMITTNIGVILPLSGKKSVYGLKALYGIDTALNKNQSQNFKLHVKDSKNSQMVSSMAVRELVERDFVSFIIGGLFPATAKDEYLEAKKYGVIFISLSPIYLPKDQKNHLLIEIPGSIESQVNSIFADDFIQAMGSRVAVLYPKSDGGDAYINEIWRVAKSKSVSITNVSSYDENRTDFRGSVKKLLGLEFKRERQEEYDLWSEVYALKRGTIRRIQTLAPIIDFDWVFLPAFPKQTIQIIPSFSYFDAKRLKYVGGPSWRSRKVLKNYKRLGKLYFVGEDLDHKTDFVEDYFSRYKKNPKLLETIAFDATMLGLSLVAQDHSSREELENFLTQKSSIKAVYGEWNLIDGIWLKKMHSMSFFGGKIIEANLTPMESAQETVKPEVKSNQ